MVSPYKGKFKVTSILGKRGSEIHQGLDLVGVDSKNIYSINSGLVEIASNADPNGFGLYVRVLSDDGYRVYYGHMSSVSVKVGSRVSRGDLLGVEGSTGRSTGSHCHLEIRKTLSKSSYDDISKYTGIPNEIGIYDSDDKDSDNNININNSGIVAGSKLNLTNVKLYSSSTATSYSKLLTGTYYIYSSSVVNGRVKITNSPSRVGKTPESSNVTGYISSSLIKNKGATSAKYSVSFTESGLSESAKNELVSKLSSIGISSISIKKIT